MEHGLTQIIIDYLSRKFPIKTREINAFEEPLDPAIASKTYKKWLFPYMTVLVLFCTVATYFVGGFLIKTILTLYKMFNNASFVLVQPDMCYVVAGIIALALSKEPSEWVVKKMSSEKMVELINYGSDLEYGSDSHAVWLYIKKFLLGIALLLFVFGACHFLSVFEDTFSINNPFTSRNETYNFNQIQKIKYAPMTIFKGSKNSDTPSIHCEMKDGTTWASTNFDIVKDSSAFQFISQKSGVKIDTLFQF